VRGAEALDDGAHELLAFMAVHRMVAADHAMVLLDEDAEGAHRRLGKLEVGGLCGASGYLVLDLIASGSRARGCRR
jgi:hypothetical protein